MRANFSSAESPGTRLVVASAPAFTIGFMVRSSLSSTPMTESNGSPVLLTPSWWRASSGPRRSQTAAKTKSLEMLWMVNSCWASPISKMRPRTPTTTHAEGLGRGFGQGGNVVGDLSFAHVAKALVARFDDGADGLVGRERSRGDPRQGGFLVGMLGQRVGQLLGPRRSVVHARPLVRSCPVTTRDPGPGLCRRVLDLGQVVLRDGRQLGDAVEKMALPHLLQLLRAAESRCRYGTG